MSAITRRDLYICAYIAQGMSYEQAVFTFENKGADAALAAAGENESETDFVMNHPLYKDMQAEIARLREELAGWKSKAIGQEDYSRTVLDAANGNDKWTSEAAAITARYKNPSRSTILELLDIISSMPQGQQEQS